MALHFCSSMLTVCVSVLIFSFTFSFFFLFSSFAAVVHHVSLFLQQVSWHCIIVYPLYNITVSSYCIQRVQQHIMLIESMTLYIKAGFWLVPERWFMPFNPLALWTMMDGALSSAHSYLIIPPLCRIDPCCSPSLFSLKYYQIAPLPATAPAALFPLSVCISCPMTHAESIEQRSSFYPPMKRLRFPQVIWKGANQRCAPDLTYYLRCKSHSR